MMDIVLWDLRCSWKQQKMIKLDLIKTIVKSNDGQKEKQSEYSEFPIVLRWLYRNKSCRRWPYQTFTDREKVAALVPLLYLGCAALDGEHEHTAAPVPSSMGPWEHVPIVGRRPPYSLASRDFFHLFRNQKMKCKIISQLYGWKK